MALSFKELKEFTSSQLATLKKEYEPLRGKTMTPDQIKRLDSMLGRYSKDLLVKLANTDIPFLATSAKSRLVMKHGLKQMSYNARRVGLDINKLVLKNLVEQVKGYLIVYQKV